MKVHDPSYEARGRRDFSLVILRTSRSLGGLALLGHTLNVTAGTLSDWIYGLRTPGPAQWVLLQNVAAREGTTFSCFARSYVEQSHGTGGPFE